MQYRIAAKLKEYSKEPLKGEREQVSRGEREVKKLEIGNLQFDICNGKEPTPSCHSEGSEATKNLRTTMRRKGVRVI